MPRVSVDDDVELFVRDWGEGEPIVFLHGWPLSHRMYEQQFTDLVDRGYRCIGVDLRGYGQSDKPWSEYSYDMFADDVRAVLDDLDVEDVTLVGFSMGGGIATHYMSRHDGAHVERLALLAAASPCLTEKPDFPQGLDESEVNPLIDGAREDRPAMLSQFTDMLFHTEVSEETKRWLEGIGGDASPQATIESAKTFRDEDLRPDMADIDVPTLICHGVHDEITPFEITAEVLHDGIADSELVRFENSGHGLVTDETEKINDHLAEFAG
ncbi:alpha/beta fold hydrolase [Halomarina oriensis]|uniref:Alpha/beta fold hydrolase n=1 Tax=Halomarina oriensis TaxID=671145 RepID=A0A6B0GR71_9EURY|nr:alpha/beta hydrolase [Halomarina oriensis]MWG36079.1 alpha/beta fold hydrolase [Halomarina oriensis]